VKSTISAESILYDFRIPHDPDLQITHEQAAVALLGSIYNFPPPYRL
jgi:hypothetical protein